MDRHHRFANLEDFVKKLDGDRVIRKVLVANNGIAAVKAIRSVRRWAYETFGKEKAVEFVAMATPEDLRVNAEYIRMADQFAEVPGGSNVNNYANVELIVQLALRYNVDAVWAGWGHASENPALPNALDGCGIAFIGPPGGPMHALGDKIGSTIIAQSANVPTIDWNGNDLKMDYKASGEIPKEVYERANIRTVDQCIEAVHRVGVPVMIKASEGGGGKGIRKVTDPSDATVADAFRQVQSETPGSPIFVMRLAARSRHLEVQLLCDKYGNAIALSGRDCSVQRRHQKILEEGPPVAAPPVIWKEMERAAVRLAKEVGYVNAGTVEYLFREEEQDFFFLELNPRLQVEHPVTEMITGVNLPACQLLVAMGIPLHRIPDVRKWYEAEPYGDSVIHFDDEQNHKHKHPDGHVIAARITAENPHKGFQPTSGNIQELNFRSSRNVWGYFSVDSSGGVHEFADSQIGHLFAWGESREDARRNLALALNDLSIRGDIRTTVEYLKDLLESNDYTSNRIDTAWLDERIKTYVQSVGMDPVMVAILGAGCEAHVKTNEREREFLQQLEKGQLPNPELLKQYVDVELIYNNVKYIFRVFKSGPSSYMLRCNNSEVELEIRSLADGGFLVLVGGKSHVAYVKEEVGAKRLIVDGQTCLFVDEYDPTQVRATMGGKLVRYLVDDKATMAKDQAFAEIEVMKMNMPLTAPEEGVLTLLKPEGSVMEPGDVICTLELSDPTKVRKAELYTDPLPDLGEPWPQNRGDMPHHILVSGMTTIERVMAGYAVGSSKRKEGLQSLEECLSAPLLPALEMSELFARIRTSLPYKLCDDLESIITNFRKDIANAVQVPRENIQEDIIAPPKALDLPTSISNSTDILSGNSAKTTSNDATSTASTTTSLPATDGNTAPTGPSPPDSTSTMVPADLQQARCLFNNSSGNLNKALADCNRITCEFAKKISNALDERLSEVSAKERGTLESGPVCQIRALASKYEKGLLRFALQSISELVDQYLQAESRFAEIEHSDAVEKDHTLLELRRQLRNDLPQVHKFARSHTNVGDKNKVALRLLELIEALVRREEELAGENLIEKEKENDIENEEGKEMPRSSAIRIRENAVAVIRKVASLNTEQTNEVALEARQMLIELQQPSSRESIRHMKEVLSQVAAGDEEALVSLVEGTEAILHILMSIMATEADASLRSAALEVYVRRVYNTYAVADFEVKDEVKKGLDLVASWHFYSEANPLSLEGGNEYDSGFMNVAESFDNLQALLSGGGTPSSQPIHPSTSKHERKNSANTTPLGKVMNQDTHSVSSDSLDGFGEANQGAGRTLSSVTYDATSKSGGIKTDSVITEEEQSQQHQQQSVETTAAVTAPGYATPSSPSKQVPRSLEKQPSFSRRPRAASGWEDNEDDRESAIESLQQEEGQSQTVSESDFPARGTGDAVAPNVLRHGVLTYFPTFEEMKNQFSNLVSLLDEPESKNSLPVNVMHVVLGEAQQNATAPQSPMRKPSPEHSNSSSLSAASSYNSSSNSNASSREEVVSVRLSKFLSQRRTELQEAGVRRITFAVPPARDSLHLVVAGHGSGFYTFRHRSLYQEDRLVRHIETPMAFQLDLKRLSNFHITLVPLGKKLSMSHTVHVYKAIPKTAASKFSRGSASTKPQHRYFVRALVRQTAKMKTDDGYPIGFDSDAQEYANNNSINTGSQVDNDNPADAYPGPERVLVQSLAALEALNGGGVSRVSPTGPGGAYNHIFLNILGEAKVSPEFVEKAMRHIARRYAKRLVAAGVAEVELKVNARLDDNSPFLPVRLVASNPTGFALHVDSYVEAEDPVEPHNSVFYSITAEDGGVGASLAAMGLDQTHSKQQQQQQQQLQQQQQQQQQQQKKKNQNQNQNQNLLKEEGDDDVDDAATGYEAVTQETVPSGVGRLHGMPTTTPYAVSSAFEERRARAVAAGTCFVYDIPALFRKAVETDWRRYTARRDHVSIPSNVVYSQELVLSDDMDAGKRFGGPDSMLCSTRRPPGQNSIAMVVWHMHLVTPEYNSVSSFASGSTSDGDRAGMGMGTHSYGFGSASSSSSSSSTTVTTTGSSQSPWMKSRPGREIIVIANDLTVKAGSFGTREDELFLRASQYARKRGIPRLYIAANSGARIGLAEEVKRAFKVQWVDPEDPSKGFRYIYLDVEDYRQLGPDGRKSVIATPIPVKDDHEQTEEHEREQEREHEHEHGKVLHYRVDSIVGEATDLGVENLRGSGTIAGETSRAYNETFTATFVSGRSVGIGAYLVRLGQRTIQKGNNAPIILTGYNALNSLMGRNVYSSNAQLGGPAIMYNNGVTHACVRDDLEGISALVTWLSYVANARESPLPRRMLVAGESLDRDVEYFPPKDEAYDPRYLLTGVETADGWLSGLFDHGSFTEYLGGWAKTVVTGRARLGSIPVGVIIPENRTVECKRPADPAAPDTMETTTMQAGNVWFPDSSYKTSTAIRDINNEQLPLIFIANFRGFSGGARDMYDEILKFGSMIVDALVEFNQPVIVYLPPHGELRGGAWVVVDATINADMMEMYASSEARGGVLEPSGAVSIKFREREILAAAHRVDEKLKRLDAELRKLEDDFSAQQHSSSSSPSMSTDNSEETLKRRESLMEQVKERETRLFPVYKQLAVEFADLHDRPGRMLAKGVIESVVEWKDSRRFFVWRLRRRLEEDRICREIMKVGARGIHTMKDARDLLRERFAEHFDSSKWAPGNDRVVVDWLNDESGKQAVSSLINSLRSDTIASEVTELGLKDSAAALRGLMGVVQRLNEENLLAERDQFVQTLRRGVFLLGSGEGRGGSHNSGSGSGNSGTSGATSKR